jgi:transposase
MVAGGIDVSKQTLDLGVLEESGKRRHRRFDNDEAGFIKLYEWAIQAGVECFAMEATGTYHKALLRFLQGKGAAVVCLNPRRARQLAGGLGVLG